MMSGGPVRKFREGWALERMGFGAAHYFIRTEGNLAHSKCKRATALAGQLLNAGSWKRCKLCAQAEGERG